MEVFCEPPIFVRALRKDAKLNLTSLDQSIDQYYSGVLFYRYIPGTCDEKKADDPAEAVRRGVEELVAHHYPWAAGRMQAAEHGDGERHCLEICIGHDGGPGVQFVSARANCPLAQLGDLSLPNPAFEPLFATLHDSIPLPSLALQVTKFADGGFCVSISYHHALCDGVAASIFMQNISSCARGEGLCIQMDKVPREQRIKASNTPLLQRSSPYWTLEEIYGKYSSTIKEQSYGQSHTATKFEFLKEDLAKLRVQALSNQEECNTSFKSCSLFQVLAGLVWRAKARSMQPLKGQDPISEAFPMAIWVNVRERIIEGIPYNYMGNAFGMAIALASMRELNEKPLAFAVDKIQEAIRQVTPLRFQSEVDYLQTLGPGISRFLPGLMVVSSLAGKGFYDVDFGWGKPTYFGRHYQQLCNRFVILDNNAQFTSLNVFAAFDSPGELKSFQDALNLDLVGSS